MTEIMVVEDLDVFEDMLGKVNQHNVQTYASVQQRARFSLEKYINSPAAIINHQRRYNLPANVPIGQNEVRQGITPEDIERVTKGAGKGLHFKCPVHLTATQKMFSKYFSATGTIIYDQSQTFIGQGVLTFKTLGPLDLEGLIEKINEEKRNLAEHMMDAEINLLFYTFKEPHLLSELMGFDLENQEKNMFLELINMLNPEEWSPALRKYVIKSKTFVRDGEREVPLEEFLDLDGADDDPVEVVVQNGPEKDWPLSLKISYDLFDFLSKKFIAGRKRGLNAKEIEQFERLVANL